jgi:hypothetical protein
VRVGFHAIEPIGTIPNEAPVAVDDFIAVDEDDSILFDPTVNDTDPDDDPLWVKWVQVETEHGRTYWEDGGHIRYIPNPNYENTTGTPYYGPDSFTYVVTDGLAESTGTVYVTVNAVNDAPVAANDVLTFVNQMYQYPGPDDMTVQYVSDYNPGVLANDRDYDSSSGGGLSVDPADVDKTDELGYPTKGRVVVHENGQVSWGGPKNFNGETSFRATDSQGAKSEWVTVKLIVRRSIDPGGSVTGVADVIPIGDGPDTGNVMTNDVGAFVALSSPPSSGRVTDFGFDGSFTFWSDHTRSEPTFTYVVFSDNGGARATVQAQTTAVNLTIHHGQNGKAVSELNEYVPAGDPSKAIAGTALIPVAFPTGGFTVFNANDSNVNGTPDHEENNVPVNPAFAGSGEVDLMKLVMSKPTPVAGQPNVTLTVASSSTPRGGAGGEVVETADQGELARSARRERDGDDTGEPHPRRAVGGDDRGQLGGRRRVDHDGVRRCQGRGVRHRHLDEAQPGQDARLAGRLLHGQRREGTACRSRRQAYEQNVH